MGTGVFMAALLLSSVALFGITRDRWNWAKVAKRIGIGAASLATALAVAYFSWGAIGHFVHRPKPLQEFDGIKLGASESDVKFLRGTPDITCADPSDSKWRAWAYKLGSKDDIRVGPYFVVSFMDPDGAWSIRVTSIGGTTAILPNLDQVNEFSSLESIESRFGPPSTVNPSDDQLSRDYMFRAYNLRVTFAQGSITDYGIYHSKQPEISRPARDSKRFCIDRLGKPFP